MDGVNTLVVGYFILVLSNILYLSEINDLKLDHFLITICIFLLFLIYLFNFFGLMFLGDSGSYLISFIVGVTMINFSNNNVYYITKSSSSKLNSSAIVFKHSALSFN